MSDTDRAAKKRARYQTDPEYAERVRAKARERYAKNGLQLKRSWRRANPIRSTASSLLGAARRRALKRGLEFTLDLNWIEPRLRAGVCEASGKPLAIGLGSSPWSPSIDRRDSSKGYTVENCRLISLAWNLTRGRHGCDAAVVEWARQVVASQNTNRNSK